MKNAFPKTLKREERTSSKAKYEMNLAEFPISLLSKRLPKDRQHGIIEYRDTIKGKDGKEIARMWKVTASPEYGFGSSEIVGTLYELFQVWKEQGFETRSIMFGSIYNLVRRMGLKDAKPNYDRIRKDLNALYGLSVDAVNAFWDNEKKQYVSKKFRLFTALTAFHERPESGQRALPFASIDASEELYGSVASNAIITAAPSREWFHTLTPSEKRLSLYLSKMLHKNPQYQRDVAKIAEQLPLTAQSYKKVKQQLTQCSQGLLDKGHPLLASFHYETRPRGQSDIIVFTRTAKKTQVKPTPTSESKKATSRKQGTTVDWERLNNTEKDLLSRILEVCGDHKSEAGYLKAIRSHPRERVEMALSETRQADRAGEIKKTRGAYFNYRLSDLAEKQETAKSQPDTSSPDPANKGRLTAAVVKQMNMRGAVGNREADEAAVEASHATRRSKVR